MALSIMLRMMHRRWSGRSRWAARLGELGGRGGADVAQRRVDVLARGARTQDGDEVPDLLLIHLTVRGHGIEQRSRQAVAGRQSNAGACVLNMLNIGLLPVWPPGFTPRSSNPLAAGIAPLCNCFDRMLQSRHSKVLTFSASAIPLSLTNRLNLDCIQVQPPADRPTPMKITAPLTSEPLNVAVSEHLGAEWISAG
jgi:hypothetical protein